MTAAAVTAFPMVKVLRRGCAILSAEITSTIAYSNSAEAQEEPLNKPADCSRMLRRTGIN